MEDWWGLGGVVDDDVVDIVVIDNVCDVASLRLSLFLSRRGSTASHSESLAVRVSGTFKASFIFTLLGHGVLSQLLRASKWLPLSPIIADKVVIFLLIRR